MDRPLDTGMRPRLEGLRVPSGNPNRTWDQARVARSPADTPIVAVVAALDWTDSVAPALASAIHDATEVWIHELPYSPERVRHSLRTARENE